MSTGNVSDNRSKIIIKTSVIGIVTNIILVIIKAAVGIFSNSIVIILDAVNNLTDALSSVVTIIGAKLAGKAPDKKHPLGHGRIEYLSVVFVSAIILYAGISSLIESVKKIASPEVSEYSNLSLIIIAFPVLIKLILGIYVEGQGKRINSGALTASGADAKFDAVISASVFGSALLYRFTDISIEAYVGLLISAIIIKAGVDMMGEAFDEIIGKRADGDVSKKIKEILNAEPEILGTYDLFINNYGPNVSYASLHIELPDTMTVKEVDRLTRRIEMKVYNATGVILTAVGVYSYNTEDEDANKIKNAVQEAVLSKDWTIQFHGFYIDMEHKEMRFDVVMTFEADREEGVKILCDEIKGLYPEYEVSITADIDISD